MRESRVWTTLQRPRHPLGDAHRLRRYTLRHPARGSLLVGLIWGTFMFLFFCCASLFRDIVGTLEIMTGTTILFTALVFLATLRSRRNSKDGLGESQAVG